MGRCYVVAVAAIVAMMMSSSQPCCGFTARRLQHSNCVGVTPRSTMSKIVRLMEGDTNDDDPGKSFHNGSRFGSQSSPTILDTTVQAGTKMASIVGSTVLAAATILVVTTQLFAPLPAHAGEVGAKITKAVTTSDLGISVRQSVVKGAQIMDKIDGSWERLSDTFGLGAERSKQVGKRPQPKVIPELLPLNVAAANRLLDISDSAFLQAFPVLSRSKLQQEVDDVAKSVRVSFQRSGVTFVDSERPLLFQTGPQFNVAVYSHYKAYSNLLLLLSSNNIEQQQPGNNSKENANNKKSFLKIRSDFERFAGEALLDEWKIKESSPTSTSTSSVSSSLTKALQQTDKLAVTLRNLGLAALVDPSPPIDAEDWQDFVEGDALELNWNVAVDGDVTLNAQILLQEQGYRLYPNFARFALKQIFQDVLAAADSATTASATPSSGNASTSSMKVSVVDYYFDTDYNSDPDKFDVKEVLLGVSLENE